MMSTEKVELEQGDVLVVIVTPSFVTPVRYRGRVFVRIGPHKDIASAEEERILTERNASHLSTFDVMPCREASIDDIDTDYIRNNYLPQAIDENTLTTDIHNFKEQLSSLRLYSKQYDCPTMVAVILFGKNPRYFMPGCYLKQNGSVPAQFNVDKLTVFEVVVTNATNEALETNSAELGINSAKIAELIEFDGILLIQNILCRKYSSVELLEIMNLARTLQKLNRCSSKTFISTTLKKVLELGLLKPLYPDTLSLTMKRQMPIDAEV